MFFLVFLVFLGVVGVMGVLFQPDVRNCHFGNVIAMTVYRGWLKVTPHNPHNPQVTNRDLRGGGSND